MKTTDPRAQSESLGSLERPPSLDPARWAIFLDLDGTLVPFAATPDGVLPDPVRTRVLQSLVKRASGAVAVLTGRTLAEADRILDGSVETVAAVHGLVCRLADGEQTAFHPAAELEIVRTSLRALAKGQKGLLLEDKDLSVAFHYRQKPETAEAVREVTARLASATGLVLQEGSMVSELRTAGPNKGVSLKVLMAEPPFQGRLPVALGDDLTDEHAFVAARELGGFGVLVGPERETNARYRLETIRSDLEAHFPSYAKRSL